MYSFAINCAICFHHMQKYYCRTLKKFSRVPSLIRKTSCVFETHSLNSWKTILGIKCNVALSMSIFAKVSAMRNFSMQNFLSCLRNWQILELQTSRIKSITKSYFWDKNKSAITMPRKNTNLPSWIYRTNFWQPTVHVQQNIFEKTLIE